MKILWAAGLVLGAAGAAAEPASSPSLCEQLAARVRQSPARVWESDGSLSPWIALTDAAHAGESALVSAGREALQKAMSGILAFQVTPNLEVERLPGTGLLMGSSMAGTAECQTSMFVQVEPGLKPVPAPQGYTSPCWNLHGDLGTVLDQPAYIEHGTVSDTTTDVVLRITSWRSGGWGTACRLTIHLAVKYDLTERFCSADRNLCDTGAAGAADVAHRYDEFLRQSGAARNTSAPGALTPAFYYYGEPPDGAGGAAVERALRVIGGRWTDVAEFPLFGSRESNPYEYTFSYAGFGFFPLTLDGHTYLGAAGHAGVGWRGSTRVLLAVYTLPEPRTTVLVPLAGFTIDPHPSGLSLIEVTTGKAAVARE